MNSLGVMEDIADAVDPFELEHVTLHDYEQDFVFSEALSSDELCKENQYLKKIVTSSGLHVLHKQRVKRMFDNYGSVGLIRFFLSPKFIDVMRIWTNHEIESKDL